MKEPNRGAGNREDIKEDIRAHQQTQGSEEQDQRTRRHANVPKMKHTGEGERDSVLKLWDNTETRNKNVGGIPEKRKNKAKRNFKR